MAENIQYQKVQEITDRLEQGIMAWFQDGMVEESDDTKEALGLVNCCPAN